MEITADLLLQAYRIGVFPMGERRDDPKLHWLDPRQRAVLPLDAFHLSHRLARTVRSGNSTRHDPASRRASRQGVRVRITEPRSAASTALATTSRASGTQQSQ